MAEVDQPEDDLDNRFITEGIVPKMREEKQRRQFIFTTHNANIPVLGDAELIVCLRAAGEAAQGNAELSAEHMGSLDSPAVLGVPRKIIRGMHEHNGTVPDLIEEENRFTVRLWKQEPGGSPANTQPEAGLA